MIKLFLAILLSCFLSTSIISCSFLGSSSDESAQEVTDAEDEEFGEDEDYDPLTDEDTDLAELDDAADDNLFDDGDDTGDFDADLEEGFGDEDDTSLADAGDAIEDVTDDELLSDTDSLADVDNPVDDIDFEDEPAAEEIAAQTISEEEIVADNNDVVPDASPDAPPEESFPIDVASGDTSGDTYYDDAPKKSWVPVQKIKSAPYNKNGILANAIYIVRDGDSIGSISQKIYGDDRVSDLYKVNTTLANRGVKVGDKVYYNSPQRPNDSDSLLTYYEDLNLSPQIYTIQAGENIRTISKNLLGHSQSWKEVWATNPSIASKGNVDDSYELRYWSEGGPAVATTLAQNDFNNNQNQELPVEDDFNNTPPPPPIEENIPPPPPVVAQADIPPPPPQPIEEDLPPPPPPIEELAPPPPPVAKIAPPPPPPRVNVPPPPPPPSMGLNKKNLKRNAKKKIASTADKDQKMMLGALAIGLLAAVLLFIIYRKKKSRRAIDFNTSTTQIE